MAMLDHSAFYTSFSKLLLRVQALVLFIMAVSASLFGYRWCLLGEIGGNWDWT